MLKRTLAVFALALLASASSFGQAKLVEKVTRQGDELVIPFEKYKLSNGLTLIVHEDHSDPVVHVDVTYHVGSAREEIGKSGFAHFFEHMMFQGSDHVADEEHFKIVTESGGTLNGSTNRDRTNYFETVPTNQLETALWLEADRMGFLLDAVTQKKFEIQRATVKNERGQNYDNRPYGLVREYVARALYPYGHPYSWLTIGYLEDLDRSDVNDLKNFFLRWYGPNNATLTVGGDVEPKQVVTLAEKYFGSIPAGPEVEAVTLPAPVLEKDRYVSYEDNVRFPLLQIVFPTVPRHHPDEPALDCLADILGGGKNSLFYKNLEKPQKALQANASHPTSELGGELDLTVISFPGVPLSSAEAIVRESLKEFEQRGPTEEDVQRFVAQAEARLINGLASVRGKVSQLAAYQTFQDDPNYIADELKAYTAVTTADVMRVYNQYVKGKHAVILSVVPKGDTASIAQADNYTVSEKGYQAPDYGYDGLTYNKAKDSFDRAMRPKPGPNPLVKVPDIWNAKLRNDIKVIGTENNEIPTVTIAITIPGGHYLSASDPGKAGIAALTADMMNEGSEKYTAEAFASELEKLGSSVSVNAGDEAMTVYIQSLKKNLQPTLALAAERMFHPRFDADDFARLKKQQIEAIAFQNNQPEVIASKVYDRLLFGERSIRSIPAIGTTETVENITLDDVKAFYNQYFSAANSYAVVVGDLTESEAKPAMAFLESWAAKPVPAVTFSETPAIDKTRIYLVDKEQAPQSQIRMGYLALPYDATGEYYKATLMNYPLGGAFNSRINLNLREDKGWTYGARSYFSGSELQGPFTASAGVRADATDSSVVEFMKEIKDYHTNGITPEELAFMKSSIGQRDALDYETPYQKAGFLGRIIKYNLDKDYVKEQAKILQSITKAEIDALAKKHLQPEKMNILVVGDKQNVKAGLEKLGYEVVELDMEGNRIESSMTNEPIQIEKSATPTKQKKSRKRAAEKSGK
ncbi:zinc protease [Catalinimonas alkaloidigena]|uniref:Zinc protease n=1 Tax=Catalinimonas alkaloidigena TaxID=1075417 RepID=A0A1G8X8X8_9BACT|nr:pitrilysin family protein [Catalinimonas alkaloidigena]SDJ87159.1 zinc protease [Catalinimonas alkaloidigena]